MSDSLLLSTSLKENKEYLQKMLPLGNSFDLITRDMTLGGISCYFVGINGMCDLELVLWIFSSIQSSDCKSQNLPPCEYLPELIKDRFLYTQVSFSSSLEKLVNSLVCGPCIVLFEGFAQGMILDTRKYPARSVEEPDTEKVIRGAKDGFVETLLTNCNLIRRRLRSPRLTFALQSVGEISKTDVAVSYVEGLCDEKLVTRVKETLSDLRVSALTMGIQSLKELLVKQSFFHPMPSCFLTARPDVACSYLAEGYVLILTDNSPFALVLPGTIFQFTQSPEDYYKSPLAGTWIRLVRMVCIFISLFLMPLFLLFAQNPDWLPAAMQGFIPPGSTPLALFVYALFVELVLDLFKYASSHTSSSYSGAFAIVGGLLIGDTAIKLEWANNEIIFYGAVTLLATLGLVSVELSDAIRLYRLFLLVLTGLLPTWGFFAGLALILLSIFTTPTFGKKSYFWPLFPLCWSALKTLLFRRPTDKAQPEKGEL